MQAMSEDSFERISVFSGWKELIKEWSSVYPDTIFFCFRYDFHQTTDTAVKKSWSEYATLRHCEVDGFNI